MLPKLIFLPQQSIEMLIAENYISGASDIQEQQNNRSGERLITVDQNRLERALDQQFSAINQRFRRSLDPSSSITVIL